MASLELDERSGRFRARFRYAGREFKRSLKTSDFKEAKALLGRLEYTVQLIERGELEIPDAADPATFIFTAGKKNGDERGKGETLTLKRLFEQYFEKLPPGSKEPSTIKTERLHEKNLLRHLKGSLAAQSLTVAMVQGYVQKRSRDKYRGKAIRPDTIKLELTTLRLIWNWAVSQELLSGPSPVRGIKYAKPDEKPPFMTMAEIHRIVARGGVSAEEEATLWESLYLTRSEIAGVLDHVKRNPGEPFVYPMFVFVAHTGARRSEILRARIDDFDFESETVLIREKKKSKTKATTYRRVAMTRLLKSVMAEWFADHPGGQFAIAREGENGPYTPSVHEAHNHFKRALTDSPWSRIRGFHVFRHSFASNLAAASVDQRVIDEFLGHTTEEMRRRYRHLFTSTLDSVLDHLVAKSMAPFFLRHRRIIDENPPSAQLRYIIRRMPLEIHLAVHRVFPFDSRGSNLPVMLVPIGRRRGRIDAHHTAVILVGERNLLALPVRGSKSVECRLFLRRVATKLDYHFFFVGTKNLFHFEEAVLKLQQISARRDDPRATLGTAGLRDCATFVGVLG